MKHQYQKGYIVNVDLGVPPNEIKGHEQGFERPCLVIKSFNQLELAIIIPCTSKQPKQNFYTIVTLLKHTAGLTSDSYLLCHQIRTVSFNRMKDVRGKLDTQNLLKVMAVLSDTLEL